LHACPFLALNTRYEMNITNNHSILNERVWSSCCWVLLLVHIVCYLCKLSISRIIKNNKGTKPNWLYILFKKWIKCWYRNPGIPTPEIPGLHAIIVELIFLDFQEYQIFSDNKSKVQKSIWNMLLPIVCGNPAPVKSNQ
jgi:hypothetical protein